MNLDTRERILNAFRVGMDVRASEFNCTEAELEEIIQDLRDEGFVIELVMFH